MIRFEKSGQLKTVLGAGISYTINKKLTLSTGVYTARKVYAAAPQDYKFSYLPPNFNYLTKVEGDCRVLEIPVMAAYNFGFTRKSNWFVAAGVSTFLMKKEKYGYLYTYPTGISYTYTREINNENKNLFSVADFSVGYKRNINRTLFVSAEPYLKLPLNGVGDGKLKMNSTGILFSVGFKPFAGKLHANK
jgi:hypothetical protein